MTTTEPRPRPGPPLRGLLVDCAACGRGGLWDLATATVSHPDRSRCELPPRDHRRTR